MSETEYDHIELVEHVLNRDAPWYDPEECIRAGHHERLHAALAASEELIEAAQKLADGRVLAARAATKDRQIRIEELHSLVEGVTLLLERERTKVSAKNHDLYKAQSEVRKLSREVSQLRERLAQYEPETDDDC